MIKIKNIKKIFKSKKRDNIQNTGKRKRDDNREIGVITYSFILIFLGLIIYLFFYLQYRSEDSINNPYNKRQAILEERVIRGDIVSSDGKVLATTDVDDDGNTKRIYPYGNMFAHVVGYSTHGVLGLERSQNFKLLKSHDGIINQIENEISGKKNYGDKVLTTLNFKMQEAAYNSMAGKRGAVIAMNAKTGEILAMVSKPDFNPNDICEEWDAINADENSILLNRATMGLYPPGSTFKIVTALEYLKEQNNHAEDYEFDCTGTFEYQGSSISCYHKQKHGEVNFENSFAKSCNSSFANITSGLNKSEFENTCKEMLFDSDLPLPFPYSKGKVDINKNSTTDELMQTGIGQGNTMVSPAQITLITAAIANEGILMKPYIVSRVRTIGNKNVSRYFSEEYERIMPEFYADSLYKLMLSTVEYGTATKLKSKSNYIAGGKTGSAEYSADKTKSHAWFTGFASNDEDTIVVTVLVEGGGSGGEVSVPIAGSVFDAYFN